MAHRTLNRVTGFFGDCREHPHNRRLSKKQQLAADLWGKLFPEQRMPYRASDVYAELKSAGYAWRSNTWLETDAAIAADGDDLEESRGAAQPC